jgi:hypothetical protein
VTGYLLDTNVLGLIDVAAVVRRSDGSRSALHFVGLCLTASAPRDTEEPRCGADSGDRPWYRPAVAAEPPGRRSWRSSREGTPIGLEDVLIGSALVQYRDAEREASRRIEGLSVKLVDLTHRIKAVSRWGSGASDRPVPVTGPICSAPS